ncbi:mRNA splicing factor, Cwf18 [Heracleum sosnowskyi]|uniref:mRNA splicing factor, Cwf18 n=1 Tax=Heracleum sosnowskyi TaxID=360622 RepID=A0AAD8MT68_9APIA|nr:mRNA splicing factor, Cwf18 [Heracleum sosnowskyi]
MGSEEEVSVEQAAAERRERLRALKAAKQLSETAADEDKSVQAQGDDDPEDADPDTEEKNISMKFRNYLPHDKQLQEGKLAPPVLPKFEDPVATEPPAQDNKEDPFLNIAPKKPNWDLRRDVQKKLDKLEKRTQKAIFQLMEEQEKQKKLAEEEEEEEAGGLQEQ